MGEGELYVLLLGLASAHVPLHLLIYLFFVRGEPRWHGERQILSFHVVSVAVLLGILLLAVWSVPTGASVALAAAILLIHCIYSLTFLEFWTLSQISYSREILLKAEAGAFAGPHSLPQDLVELGETKRSGRLESLRGLGLVKLEGERWSLTPRGTMASAVLRFLQWLPNSRNAG